MGAKAEAAAEVGNLDAQWYMSLTAVQREDISKKLISGNSGSTKRSLPRVGSALLLYSGLTAGRLMQPLWKMFLFLLRFIGNLSWTGGSKLNTSGAPAKWWMNPTVEEVSKSYFALASRKIIGKKREFSLLMSDCSNLSCPVTQVGGSISIAQPQELLNRTVSKSPNTSSLLQWISLLCHYNLLSSWHELTFPIPLPLWNNLIFSLAHKQFHITPRNHFSPCQ